MSFEQRKEDKRKAIEKNVDLEEQRHQEKLELDKRIHEENRNNPIFKQMREIANSAELREALLAYAEIFGDEAREHSINIYDDYDIPVWAPNILRTGFGTVTLSMYLCEYSHHQGEDHYSGEHYLQIKINADKEDQLLISLEGITHIFYSLDELLDFIAEKIVEEEINLESKS